MPAKKKRATARPRQRRVDFAAVSSISARVNLEDISTISFSAEALQPLAGLFAPQLDQRVRVMGALAGSADESAAVMIKAEYAAMHEGAEVARVQATLLASYSLRDGGAWDDLPSEAVDQFAEINGIYNTWSYIRELVGSSLTRVGLSGVLLPVWRPPAVLPPKGEFFVIHHHADAKDDPA
jgi:hypothetical protein